MMRHEHDQDGPRAYAPPARERVHVDEEPQPRETRVRDGRTRERQPQHPATTTDDPSPW